MNNLKQKDETLVSVVVPIYNVEQYLRKCIDSLLVQTHENLEIILVNDGSTDSSLQICCEYETLDDRVKVVHKENGGLSSARNEGIRNATGRYITFIDSDDYVSRNYVEVLFRNASDTSISIVNHKRVYENSWVRYPYSMLGACPIGYLLLNIITIKLIYFSQFLLIFLSFYLLLLSISSFTIIIKTS